MTTLNPDIERTMILWFVFHSPEYFSENFKHQRGWHPKTRSLSRPQTLGSTITAHSHSFESDFKDDHLFYFQRPFNWLGTFKARHFSFYHILPSGRFRNVCSTWLIRPLLLSTMQCLMIVMNQPNFSFILLLGQTEWQFLKQAISPPPFKHLVNWGIPYYDKLVLNNSGFPNIWHVNIDWLWSFQHGKCVRP